jgi:polygalacturonase
MMIGMHSVTGLEIGNITLRDGARWHVHPVWCENVHIHDIHVFAPREHAGHPLGGNDGIDPDSCRNVTMEDVWIDTGDDAISIKSVGPGPCDDVQIRRATLISRNFAVGEHTTGGITNILLEDSRIGDDQGSAAWGIKFKVPGTGVVENITLHRLQLGRIVAKTYVSHASLLRSTGQSC